MMVFLAYWLPSGLPFGDGGSVAHRERKPAVVIISGTCLCQLEGLVQPLGGEDGVKIGTEIMQP